MTKEELNRKMQERAFAAIDDLIYESLYQDIIMLRLAPGSKINESKMSTELGVSRSPVKNAVTRLSDQGLVQKEEGKSPVVLPITKESCKLLYEARLCVEGHAAFLAAKRITKQEIEQLGVLVEAYEKGDERTQTDSDHDFHALVIRASRNLYIEQLYGTIQYRLLHYRRSSYCNIDPQKRQTILQQTVKQHRVIYQALLLGFSEMAKSEMEQDVSSMLDVFSVWN